MKRLLPLLLLAGCATTPYQSDYQRLMSACDGPDPERAADCRGTLTGIYLQAQQVTVPVTPRPVRTEPAPANCTVQPIIYGNPGYGQTVRCY